MGVSDYAYCTLEDSETGIPIYLIATLKFILELRYQGCDPWCIIVACREVSLTLPGLGLAP